MIEPLGVKLGLSGGDVDGGGFFIRRGRETVSLCRRGSKIFTHFLLSKEFPIGIGEWM